nr:amidohydrolase [Terricaulis sp.]
MKNVMFAALAVLAVAQPAFAQEQQGFSAPVETQIQSVLPRMIAWRRDFHQNPELSYEEVRTARVVAAHLRSLRIEVRSGVLAAGEKLYHIV